MLLPLLFACGRSPKADADGPKASASVSAGSKLAAAAPASSPPAIAAESAAASDAFAPPSDALLKDEEACEAAMSAAALDLPEVKKEQAHGNDDAPFGGLTYPAEGKHFSLSLGFHHPERFESVFFVDWMDGAFSVKNGDELLAVPPAALARVKAACPK